MARKALEYMTPQKLFLDDFSDTDLEKLASVVAHLASCDGHGSGWPDRTAAEFLASDMSKHGTLTLTTLRKVARAFFIGDEQYFQGRRAKIEGLPASTCPFPKYLEDLDYDMSFSRACWLEGWQSVPSLQATTEDQQSPKVASRFSSEKDGFQISPTERFSSLQNSMCKQYEGFSEVLAKAVGEIFFEALNMRRTPTKQPKEHYVFAGIALPETKILYKIEGNQILLMDLVYTQPRMF